MSSIAEFVVICQFICLKGPFLRNDHQRWWQCLGVDGEVMSVVVGRFLR